MVRNTAREIAVHLAYELSFTDKTAEELVAERLSRDGFAELAGEDELYSEAPNAKQAEYIRANLLVLDDEIIAGDICSVYAKNGFMHGLQLPQQPK